MKNLFRTLFVAVAATFGFGMSLACSSCASTMGSDKVIERNQSVGRFSKVEMYTSADVKFTQGANTSVRIVGNADLVENLVVEQSGGCLTLKSKSSRVLKWNNSRNNQLTVYVSSPRLDGVKLAGSGDFEANGNINTDNLDVQLNGSGDVKFGRVTCNKATLKLNGSGDLNAKALKATNAYLQLNGSGDLDARLEGVGKTTLRLQGSGDMDVNFVNCGEADCTLQGSGDIELKGTLRSLSKSKKGSGDIDTKGVRVR